MTATQHTQMIQVGQRINPQAALLRTWRLEGGVSAQVIGFEIKLPHGTTQKLLMRRHGEVDLASNPNIAADEFKLLQILKAAGLPVPIPYLVDTSNEIFPTPYIVVEYIDGQTGFDPADLSSCLQQMAEQLAATHHVDATQWQLDFLPSLDKRYATMFSRRPTELDETIGEGQIRTTLETVWPLSSPNQPVLLHGDYWPGNILWHNGQLAAIIDWEDAKIGDPLADLANTRLEILWAYGLEAMQQFTEHYLSMTTLDISHLPYWDLWAALRPASKISEWASDEAGAQYMREVHHLFVSQAFEQIASR